ncbi:MAG: hypothetical protein K8R18_11220 [Parvibaculum sp.]|uniref:hypothetical protein n=1 Tax=Parvibaculum sp. TaxID=2024848 RepID=UPI0025F0BBFA|nr:hypothetical protein [Parvibaculum sp.]MCE9650182.1 hypothetical protein [Parvibaculum sp.]
MDKFFSRVISHWRVLAIDLKFAAPYVLGFLAVGLLLLVFMVEMPSNASISNFGPGWRCLYGKGASDICFRDVSPPQVPKEH